MHKDSHSLIDDKEFHHVLINNIKQFSGATFVRAIPDYRDGVKLVARRIIYTMAKEDITHFTKVLVVCGETLKVHPYNDASIAGALVLMTQPFTTPYPYFVGQGNYGSLEDTDSYAASRYIETRLSKFCIDVITQDIDNYSIDYDDNYDNTRKEITYLPSRLPLNLLQGDYGIAEAYTHSTASHNLSDVVSICIKYIKNKNISLKELVKGFYPDFPTGGIITNKSEIAKAYSLEADEFERLAREKVTFTIKIKGKIEILNDDCSILITELPYGISFQKIRDKIQDEVLNRNNIVLANVINFGNRNNKDGSISYEIFCKKGSNLREIANNLLLKTQLSRSLPLQMMYNFEETIKRCSIKGIVENWYRIRIKTLRRKFNFEHSDLQNKTHVLEGILSIYDRMKEAINKIMNCDDKDSAIKMLCKEYDLSLVQSKGIIEMQISTLTRMSKRKLITDIERNYRNIKDIDNKLFNLDTVIIDQLVEIEKKYRRERRTEIIDDTGITNNINISSGMLLWNRDSIGIFDKNSIINNRSIYMTMKSYKIDGKSIKEISGSHPITKDIIGLITFTNDGIGKRIKTKDISMTNSWYTLTGLNNPLTSIVPVYDEEDIIIVMNDEMKVKKIKALDIQSRVVTGKIISSYNAQKSDATVLIYDETGNYLYIDHDDIPLLSRISNGNITGFEKDKKIIMRVLNSKEDLICILLDSKTHENSSFIYGLDSNTLEITSRTRKPKPFFDKLHKSFSFNGIIPLSGEFLNDSILVIIGDSGLSKVNPRMLKQRNLAHLIKNHGICGIQII